MDSDQPLPSILGDIDQRQDDVIRRLDQLNARIEDLLRSWTAGLSAEGEAGEGHGNPVPPTTAPRAPDARAA